MKQPLAAAEARKLAREILVDGTVSFTSHCQKELAKDGKTTVDATNVIRGGAYSRQSGKTALGAIEHQRNGWLW